MDLFSIPIVATAISIVICWALFAIFCSLIHEAIVQIMSERGRFMKKWLFTQLYDHPNGINWASMVYMHGAIDLLTRKTSMPTSDIEPKLFAETLIEVVGNAQVVQMHKDKVVIKDLKNPKEKSLHFKSDLLNNFKAATLVLKPSDVVTLFQKSMHSAEMCSPPGELQNETSIYNSLMTQIESWFIEMEERISFWYKKKTRIRLFILGALLALIVNVDSVQLFSYFIKSPNSRNALMNYYESNADRLNEMARNTADSITGLDIKTKLDSFSVEMDSLSKAIEIPIGWEYSMLNLTREHISNIQKKDISLFWTIVCHPGPFIVRFFRMLFWLKLFGIILSGFAASFGAPFWFDLLKKIYSRKPQNEK